MKNFGLVHIPNIFFVEPVTLLIQVINAMCGGTVAMNVAINYSDSISKLICCSGIARNGIIKKPLYAKIMIPRKKRK